MPGLVPGIHAFLVAKAWMAGTSPAMTNESSSPPGKQTFRDEELLAAVVADLIGDVRHVAVGNASPIPATAALLARAHGDELNLGRPYVSLLGSPRHTFWTDG